MLLNIRSGRVVSQPVDNATVTIYAISGRITILRDENSVDMTTGEVLWSESDALDRIEAHEDASLLVVGVGAESLSEEELDLRAVECFQRHPMVFQKFDRPNVGYWHLADIRSCWRMSALATTTDIDCERSFRAPCPCGSMIRQRYV